MLKKHIEEKSLLHIVKPCYKEPLNKVNLNLAKWFWNPFIVFPLLKELCNNKNPILTDKFSSPFRNVKARFNCIYTYIYRETLFADIKSLFLLRWCWSLFRHFFVPHHPTPLPPPPLSPSLYSSWKIWWWLPSIGWVRGMPRESVARLDRMAQIHGAFEWAKRKSVPCRVWRLTRWPAKEVHGERDRRRCCIVSLPPSSSYASRAGGTVDSAVDEVTSLKVHGERKYHVRTRSRSS